MVSTLLAKYENNPRLDIIINSSFNQIPDWDTLRSIFGEGVYINPGVPELEWRELSLATPYDLGKDLGERTILGKGRVIRFEGRMIDSFTIQAQRRGVITDLSWMETGQYSFTLTKDGNNIIVGTRGGSESVGQVIALPVGSVGYPSEEDEYVKRLFFGNSEMEIDPCKLATMKEGWEEGAIHPKEDLEYLDLIGVYRQDKGSAAPSNIFMYLSRLNIDGKEIIERHRRSMREYNAIKDKFKTNADSSQVEIMARTHLQILAFHLPENGWAKDAWENESLSLWPADPRDLVKMFEAKPNENLKHGMYGAIALYVLDTNENLFGRLMSLPQFKEQLKEDF